MPVVTKEKPDLTLPGEAPASIDRHHNKPPLEEIIPVEFREALLSERADFLVKFESLIESASRAYADDDASLGKCGDLVKAFRLCDSHIIAVHKAVKQPYLDGGRLVDAEKNALILRLADAKSRVEMIGNAYVAERDAKAKAERDRVAAEQRAAAEAAATAERERRLAEEEAARSIRDAANEGERKAAEARAVQARKDAEEAASAASLAPTASVKSEPVRSDAGSTVSSGTDWAFEVEDYAKAARFKAIISDPKVREAIEASVKRLVKQTKGNLDIPGVRQWPVSKANFR